jgi:glycosyltransferase involved in cell wall biosynthesis
VTPSTSHSQLTQVVMFQRRPLPGQHSLERVFQDVRSALPDDIQVITQVLPFESRGFANRLRNMLFAWRNRGGINHITGDVHYLALVLPRRSTVLTILDLVGIERLRGVRRWLLILLWYRLPGRRAQRITVISEWTRDQLTSLLPHLEGKIGVIHCPVSASFARSQRPAQQRTVVLQVGTSWTKNLDRVIDAVAGLQIHLRVIGRLDDSQRRRLLEANVDYSQIADLPDESLAAEYANCDLVMFASLYEGFGLPILEAQAVGRPVITSDAASMPEVAGRGALFVDPHDASQIRAAVRSLAADEDLYDSLVEQGLENVQRFHLPSIAESYAELYRTIKQTIVPSSEPLP